MLSFSEDCRADARRNLGLPVEAHVVMWLGRRSMLTKVDPWPSYYVLQRAASRLGRPIWLVECGPDDTPEQARHFQELQKYCPDSMFTSRGISMPEHVKQKALIACDFVLSLVDKFKKHLAFRLAKLWPLADQLLPQTGMVTVT